MEAREKGDWLAVLKGWRRAQKLMIDLKIAVAVDGVEDAAAGLSRMGDCRDRCQRWRRQSRRRASCIIAIKSPAAGREKLTP